MKSDMKKGNLCIFLGMLLIFAALGLSVYNVMDETRANSVSVEVLTQMKPEIVEVSQEIQPDYEVFPDMEMPVKEIDGNDYIGVLSFSAFDMEMPVMRLELSEIEDCTLQIYRFGI